jgi:hypothetical protein
MDAINFWLGIRQWFSHLRLGTQIGKVEPQYRKYESNVSRSRTRPTVRERGDSGFIQTFQSNRLTPHPSRKGVQYPSLLTQCYFGVAGLAQMLKKCVNMMFAQPDARAIFECVVRGHMNSP